MPSTRRQFLEQAVSGLALILAIPSLGCRPQGGGAPFAPSQWLAIAPDGSVTLVLDKAEMGQGVSTSVPMIMAEELGVEWSRVRVEMARPGPDFTEMGTGGSGSVIETWFGPRLAAARAREMLVAAAAAKWGVAPEECVTESGEVRHGRRRAGFGELVEAARQLPVPDEPRLKPPEQYRLLGTRVPDRALPELVRGAVTYGADVRLPGMRYAAIARCPTKGGAVRSYDDTGARAVAGVRDVVELPGGVAVVADSTWAALRGRDALRLDFADGPDASFDNADGWRRLERALARGGKTARRAGNAAAALGRAARRFAAEYRWTWQAHSAIEPLSAVASVAGGGCEIWAGMQNPNAAQRLVAEALGIDEGRVVVNVLRLGGGFGRRLASDFVVEAALVSRAAGGPVQVVWSREDDFRHDRFNPAQLNRLEAGLDASGRIAAWRHRVADFHLSMFGAYDAEYDPPAGGDPWGGFDTPYDVADLEVELALVESPVETGAWRSVTYPAAVLARESFLDEIARETGRDPLALRLELIPSPGLVRRGETELPNGDRLRRVLELVAERGDWGRPLPDLGAGRRVGRGLACNPYHRGTMVAQVAEVSVGAEGDVRVHRIVNAVDCGQPINRLGIEQQFEGGVAWALSALLGPGVRFERGRAQGGSFSEYPVLRIDQMPAVETHVVESTLRPFGMGEPPVPAVAPAVLNAVHQATGVRIRDLPIDRTTLRA